jgi:hypothetical protein
VVVWPINAPRWGALGEWGRKPRPLAWAEGSRTFGPNLRVALSPVAAGFQSASLSGRNCASHRDPARTSRPKEVRHVTPRSLRRPPLLSSSAVSAGRATRPKPASSGGRRLCTATKSFSRSWGGTTRAPAAPAAAFKNCCLPTECFRGKRARLLLLGTEFVSGRRARPNGPATRAGLVGGRVQANRCVCLSLQSRDRPQGLP